MYSLVLQQHCESLTKLQERWPTPLALAIRYASQACTAVTIATSLAGSPAPLEFRWLPPVLSDISDNGSPLADIDPGDHVLDLDQIALADILEDTEAPSSAKDDGLCNAAEEEEEKNTHSVDLIWRLPFVSSIRIYYVLCRNTISQTLGIDTITINSNAFTICDIFARRIRQAQDGFPHLTFEADDYECLASPTARLNDICINNCSALLYSQFLSLNAAQCTILSTHNLPRVRYHADDNVLWRNVAWTHYWEKCVWILPIHRLSPVGHWVICIIKFSSKQLLLFDSLAEQKPWKRDIKVF